MKDYSTSQLRNVCLMSHGGAGKTTLTEAMLYNTGVLERLGKVAEGTTTSDFEPEEIRRKISVSTAIAPCEWRDHKINVLDTPGYFDFVGEVKQGLRASDGAIILVSAKDGVAVGTEKSWEYAKEQEIPKIILMSKMDEENASFTKTFNQLKGIFGKGIIAFHIPIIENDRFIGIVDVVHLIAKKFDKNQFVETSIPTNLTEQINELREGIMEVVAETDEELLQKYFDAIPFTAEEIRKGLHRGILSGSIVPVLCASAIHNAGIQLLMDAILEYLPSPDEKRTILAKDIRGDVTMELEVSPKEVLSALVFKTIADPFVGKISLFRVFTGTLKTDSVVYNTTTEKTEKVAQLFMLRGKKHLPVDQLIAGDIGAVAKLQMTNTNDTLCDPSRPVMLANIVFPEPAISLAVEPKAKGDEEKISTGLHRLQEEDPTFKFYIDKETHQTIICGIGEQHLDVIISKLKAKFGVSVHLTNPKVPYRETIKKKIKIEGKHKKQSGGHGQYGHVWIEFEHGPLEELIFEEKIFGGAVPRQYFPAVEKGLREALVKGVLAGYPVVNLKAVLVDGSYHDVDSSEMAFKIAAKLAYKKGLMLASPALLEPIHHVEVIVPESLMGDIIGDINKRRGRIMGMNPKEGGLQQVEAEVPLSEMFKYANDLRSMTHGRGYFKMWFARYEEAPPNIAQKVIEEAKKHMVEEVEES